MHDTFSQEPIKRQKEVGLRGLFFLFATVVLCWLTAGIYVGAKSRAEFVSLHTLLFVFDGLFVCFLVTSWRMLYVKGRQYFSPAYLLFFDWYPMLIALILFLASATGLLQRLK